jgi:deoxyribonuclease IV
MPLFGAHMSIAGGYHLALLAARNHSCDTVQLFTKNSNQWKAKAIAAEEAVVFRRLLRETGLRKAISHNCYLINLASPEPILFRKSVEAFVVEMQRAEQLGLSYLVTHPGAHVGSGEEAALRRVAKALDEVQIRCAGFRVRVLLETTAGQGSTLGYQFEHLARILSLVKEPRLYGICFDTCHVFAAGYALAPRKEYCSTMQAFDKLIGLNRIEVFHVNDSLKPLGSKVDRHAHIGKGVMGLEPFRILVNDSQFCNRPMILETPKENIDGKEMDTVNLQLLRGLREKKFSKNIQSWFR